MAPTIQSQMETLTPSKTGGGFVKASLIVTAIILTLLVVAIVMLAMKVIAIEASIDANKHQLDETILTIKENKADVTANKASIDANKHQLDGNILEIKKNTENVTAIEANLDVIFHATSLQDYETGLVETGGCWICAFKLVPVILECAATVGADQFELIWECATAAVGAGSSCLHCICEVMCNHGYCFKGCGDTTANMQAGIVEKSHPTNILSKTCCSAFEAGIKALAPEIPTKVLTAIDYVCEKIPATMGCDLICNAIIIRVLHLKDKCLKLCNELIEAGECNGDGSDTTTAFSLMTKSRADSCLLAYNYCLQIGQPPLLCSIAYQECKHGNLGNLTSHGPSHTLTGTVALRNDWDITVTGTIKYESLFCKNDGYSLGPGGQHNYHTGACLITHITGSYSRNGVKGTCYQYSAPGGTSYRDFHITKNGDTCVIDRY